MDKNTLAHTKWNCKYHIVFGGVKLLWSFWLTDPKTPQQLDTAVSLLWSKVFVS